MTNEITKGRYLIDFKRPKQRGRSHAAKSAGKF